MILILCFWYFRRCTVAWSLQNRTILGYRVNFINLESQNHVILHWNRINRWNLRRNTTFDITQAIFDPIFLKSDFRICILSSWPLSTWRNHRSSHRFRKANSKGVLLQIILQINLQRITNNRTALYSQLFILLILQ